MKRVRKKCFSALMLAIVMALATITASAAPFYGDINKDGVVDSTDGVVMNRHILDIDKVSDTSMMDLNGDGVIDSTDYVLLKRYILDIISVFPVEEMDSDPDDGSWQSNNGTIELGHTITASGRGVSVDGSIVNITAGGDHVVTGTLTDGMIYVETEDKVRLTLKDANITNSNGPAIYFEKVDKGFITIADGTENYLADGSPYSYEDARATLFSKDDLVINGKGTLHVEGNDRHGIRSNNDLIIEDGNIFINAATDGINTSDKCEILGGNINIVADSDGIDIGETILIEDGIINIVSEDDGIKASETITIKGGTYDINVASDGIDGKMDVIIEGGTFDIKAGKHGITANDELIISGGDFKIDATSDGLDCDDDVLITGGDFNIRAGKDGLNVEGDVTITGGDFYMTTHDEGIDGDEDIIIEGGTFVVEAGDDGFQAKGDIIIIDGIIDLSAVSEGFQSGGRVEIRDGNIDITAGSAIRAKYDITINGGTTNVTQSIEDLESYSDEVKVNGGQLNITTVAGNDFATEKNKEILRGDIIFSEPSKAFSNSISVELDTRIDNAQIRYTTDGSVPNSNSPVYTNPLSFTTTTQLRAQAFVNGNERGKMGSAVYVATEINTSHDIPVLILDAYGQSKPDREYIDAAFMLIEPDGNEVSFLEEPDVATRAGFKLRGQSSANFEKAPYRIELWNNGYREDAKYPLLGMPEDGDWIILSPFPDKALMRNPISYELGEAKGLTAPRYRFVEVYINLEGDTVTDRDYEGVYHLVERLEVNSRRVDVARLDDDDLSEPEITGGYFMQFNMGATDPPLIEGDGWSELEVTDPSDLTSEQLAWIADYIQKTHNAIHSSNPSDPNTGYPAYIDVDSFVDYIIHNELALQGDSYVRSTRLHKDRGEKLVAGPLWDFDLAYASFTGFGGFGGGGTTVEGYQFQQTMDRMMGGGRVCDWWETLMYDPSFQSKVRERWEELRRGPYSDQQLRALVDNLAEPIKNAAERNFNRWNILGTQTVGGFGTQTTQTWEQQLDILKDFLVQRAAWLDNAGWETEPNSGGGWDFGGGGGGDWDFGGGGGW
ncbi:carbohydrate-binding domain-containing protein [Herbivorax sp. ANBcel31]|uniref:carbohydrate-binding domain-containing protein n=1 Tax=Herbivorax sp. ANBcel31 TaxID=3069754 RepID=UPI0027AE88F8|nr:carbohydrate-binding domain-containing protein [Herbivorax sp. ANBcel31]MDQ2086135.1 carbohydrate-binding domain-containing protein [Herbivorax sp. ANBcel31]